MLNCVQELFFWGKEKVSLLERCLHFRGVLRERSLTDLGELAGIEALMASREPFLSVRDTPDHL